MSIASLSEDSFALLAFFSCSNYHRAYELASARGRMGRTIFLELSGDGYVLLDVYDNLIRQGGTGGLSRRRPLRATTSLYVSCVRISFKRSDGLKAEESTSKHET